MPHPADFLTRRDLLKASAASLAAGLTPALFAQDSSKPLRAGIIGLDTSHVTAFTNILNNPKNEGDLAGVRVVAGFPGGTDIPASKNRVEGFTKTLKEKYQVEIVDSIDALLKKVDVVLLESVDGRPHLDQARPVFKAGKPVFIDKPLAGSLADALAIVELAKETKTPFFSSSSLRFAPKVQELRKTGKVSTVNAAGKPVDLEIGDILGCDSYGPCPLEPTHPDLFWYGIHGCELLFTVMGTGLESVSRTSTKETDVVAGAWKGGRIGTFRGIRAGKADYGATVFGSKGVAPVGGSGGYEPLLVEICKFFKTRKPPVAPEETLELFAFMEAADESKRQAGKPVKVDEVLAKARDKRKV